jgi:hypothetical protein
MESNTKVRAEMEYMGGKVYKVYRIHGKALQTPVAKSRAERERQLAAVECGQ